MQFAQSMEERWGAQSDPGSLVAKAGSPRYARQPASCVENRAEGPSKVGAGATKAPNPKVGPPPLRFHLKRSCVTCAAVEGSNLGG